MLGRAEIGGFPMSVPSPSVLDTSAVSSARAVALGAVHDVTDRPPHVVEGALLRDWLFEPESGAVLAEWPSASEPGQSIVLQETLSPFVAREHGSWRNVGGDLYLDRKIPRVDKGSAAVYCWSRWPHDPMHWWTDVASRAHLASIDDRLAGQPLLVPPLSDWQRDGLVALGVDLGRILDLDVPGGELVRSRLYFPGALSLGGRGAISLDTCWPMPASRQERGARWSVPCSGPADLRPSVGQRQSGDPQRSWCNDRAHDNGFEIVFPGLSFEETVRTFAAAEVVVAPTGARWPARYSP